MYSRTLLLFVAAGSVIVTGVSSAQELPSVQRVLRGLRETDTLHGGLVVGLRGDKPGGTNFNNAQYARIGYAEAGSDDRRTTGGMNPVQDQNGFNQNLAAFGGSFIQTRDFSRDGNVAPGVFSASTNHATHAAGITLSRDAANRGISRNAVGYMALFDDYIGNRRLNDPADFARMKDAFNYLAVIAPPVDVVNASFGFQNKRVGGVNSAVVQADLTGNSYASKLLDWYAWQKDVLTVKSAGNTGSGTGLVTIPGDGFNGLTVGSMDGERVRSTSAFRPLANGRNGVHLVAPGTNVQSVGFDGSFPTGSGTSFAAPHVTGVVANLISAAKQARAGNARTDKGDRFSIDPRVLKAVMINSGTHSTPTRTQAGAAAAWTPGEVDRNDNKNWVHPLNYANGAGEVDANEAWRQYREEGPKLLNAGLANQYYENRFWDLGIVTKAADRTGQVNYITNGATQFTLPTGFWVTNMTATVTWNRHVKTDDLANGDAISMTDIDLWFQYSLNNGATWSKILASRSPNDSTEHIFLQNINDAARQNALYRLQVWVPVNGFATGLDAEGFGISVKYTAVPTPGSGLLAIVGIACIARRRRT